MDETARTIDLTALLAPERIVLESAVTTRAEAIDAVGDLLVAAGAPPSYPAAMHEREARVSTYLGAGVAVPHALVESDPGGDDDGLLAFLRMPAGVEWDGETARVAIGIAAPRSSHGAVLAALATVLLDPARTSALTGSTTADQVVAALAAPPSPQARPGGEPHPSAASRG